MSGFGTLEATVMDHMWRLGRPMLIRELLDEINTGAERTLAYTTVQTVCDRLVAKQMLRRIPAGRANRYTPVMSRDEHVAGLMAEALADSDDHASVFQRFVQLVGKKDVARLRAALDDPSR